MLFRSYRYVRHIFYDAPVPGTRHDRRRGRSHVNIYPKDRHLFCTLHAMLSTRHVEVFPKLFPQFADDVKFIKDELASMHKSLVASYTQHIKVNQENKKLSTEPIPMSSVGRSKKKSQIRVAGKYRPVWNAMIKRIPRTKNKEMIPQVVIAYLVNEKNASLLYSVLYCSD